MPPDAPEAAEAAIRKVPAGSGTDTNATSEVDPQQHNRWACVALDRIPLPCHRCCRCWNRDLCKHHLPGREPRRAIAS